MPGHLIRPYLTTTFTYYDPLETAQYACTVAIGSVVYNQPASRSILSLYSKARFLLLVETLNARCHFTHNHGICSEKYFICTVPYNYLY